MEEPRLEAEPPWRCAARSIGLGAASGAAIGAAECGRLLAQGVPRYADIALHVVGVGLIGYALLGAALGAGSGALAWILWRRPGFRAASASTCAGLGTLLAIASFVLLPQVGAAFLLPAALFWTMVALSLREFLAWTGRLSRPGIWISLGALALFAGAATFAARGGTTAGARMSAPVAKDRPNVLLVTIDTLRRDHVGCYGASDAKTPVIDAFAKSSVQFLDATSQANTTGPSHSTMLTGLYPSDHGAHKNGVPIAHGVGTLPELLSREGYSTAACVSGFTLVNGACGLAPRFEYYDDDFCAWPWMPEAASRLRLFRVAIQLANLRGRGPLRSDRPANETVDSSLAWLDSRDPKRPFFLWTHLFDPHCPYLPPAPFDPQADAPARNWYKLTTEERRELVADPREVERMRALYRAEISFSDREVGRLFERLRASGEFDDTLVILASDHGEGLGEHGYWFDHGTYLYDAELSVPLLLHLPGARHAGLQVRRQVRLLDLTPTVLDALGLEPPKGLSGISLLDALDETEGSGRPSMAQGEVAGELNGYELGGRKLSLRVGGRKLIWTSDHWLDSIRVPESWELFDLERDPTERTDTWVDAAGLPAEDPRAQSMRAMRAQVEAWRDSTAGDSARGSIAPEVRSQLNSLGY